MNDDQHPDPRCAEVMIPNGHVLAVMTAPRLCFMDFAACAVNALSQLDIRLLTTGSVFWTQGLTLGIEAAIASGFKYVLTLDYDTVFDARDVQVLYGYMESTDNIAALCPVQMRRESETILAGIHDAGGNAVSHVASTVFAPDVTKISTGHFGLSLIRLSCIRDLPKPWFVETPDIDGSWGDGKTDADVSFWHKMAAAGHGVYQANRVVLGHLELMVTWPDRQLRPIAQTASEYRLHGRPPKESDIWS